MEILKSSDGTYIQQILTDDAFTLVERQSPAGFRIRVWKRPPSNTNLSMTGVYYDLGNFSNMPLLNDVTFVPGTASDNTPDYNTLIYTQKETTGAPNATRITTQKIVQTPDASGRPVTLVSSIYSGEGTSTPPLSQENLTYTYPTSGRPWDYTITRQVLIASVTASGLIGTLVPTQSTQEVYQDFSTSVAGGDMGMKRLISFKNAFQVAGQSEQLTSYTYENDPSNPMTYGRLRSVTNPDGSWKSYAYTANPGNPATVITEYSGWKDFAAGDTTNARRKVTSVNGSVSTEENYVGSQLISRTQTTLDTSGPITTLAKQQWDGTTWHTSTTGYFPDNAGDPSAGRVCWIENADGTASTYAYNYDNHHNLTTTVRTGAGNRNGVSSDGTQVVATMAVGNIPIAQVRTPQEGIRNHIIHHCGDLVCRYGYIVGIHSGNAAGIGG